MYTYDQIYIIIFIDIQIYIPSINNNNKYIQKKITNIYCLYSNKNISSIIIFIEIKIYNHSINNNNNKYIQKNRYI